MKNQDMETTKSHYKLPQEYPYLVQINHNNLIQLIQSSYLINKSLIDFNSILTHITY